MVDGWVYKTGQPASVALTDKILAGFGRSQFTPKYVKNYLEKLGIL